MKDQAVRHLNLAKPDADISVNLRSSTGCHQNFKAIRNASTQTIPQTVIIFCAFQGSKDVKLRYCHKRKHHLIQVQGVFRKGNLTTDLKGFVEQKTWPHNLKSFNVSILPATKHLFVLPPWLCQLNLLKNTLLLMIPKIVGLQAPSSEDPNDDPKMKQMYPPKA